MKLNRASDHPGANQPPGNPEGNNPPNRKGNEMSVITFLRNKFRVITNQVTAEEQTAYDESLVTHRPQQFNGNTLMGVQTGEYMYSLLENKLNKRGIKFRLGMISINDLANAVAHKQLSVDSLVDNATFAWANASYAFFLNIQDKSIKDAEAVLSEFGLQKLGMTAIDRAKTPKRLQELTRITQMRASGKMEDLSYMEFDSGQQEELPFDGPIAVRESFMLKAAFRIRDERTRKHTIRLIKSGEMGAMIGRLEFADGLVKGAVHIVPDENLDADVVFHKTALKKELVMDDGYWHFTAFRLGNGASKVLWDMQTAVNNHDWLFTENRFYEDLGTIIPEIKAALENGELPSWIIHQHEEKHDDDGTPVVDHATAYWTEQAKKMSHIRLQQNGFPVTASANIIHMAFGSVVNQMASAEDRNAMWVPVSHAFADTIISTEAYTQMLGNAYEEWMDYYVWYQPGVGIVIPGRRFVDTASLHDTWDSDGDKAKVIHIMLWSSDEEVTERRRQQFIIPEWMDVPNSPEQAIHAGVVLRSPNGAGGYSIELINWENMPFMHTSTDLQVIDLADSPESLDDLLAVVGAQPISGAQVHSGLPMTRDDAKSMITAQMSNPGVGSFANANMLWVSANGPSYPSSLPAQGNDIIDIVQQSADLDAFVMIKELVDGMWEDMASTDMEVDAYVFRTRAPKKYVEDADATAWTIIEGSWTRMHRKYLETIKELRATVSEGSFKIRQTSWFVPFIMEQIPVVNPNTRQFCKDFVVKYEKKLRATDMRYGNVNTKDRFIKMMLAADRSDAVANIVQEMVDELMTTSFPNMYAVALYRYIVDGSLNGNKWGMSDRIIFQGGKPGQTTVMDLFIQGVLDLNTNHTEVES